ncbi:MAG: rod shape-determining protein MreC [bacterium]
MSREFLYALRLLVVSLVVAFIVNVGPMKHLESAFFASPARFFNIQALRFRLFGSAFWANIAQLPELSGRMATLTEKNLVLRSEVSILKEENYRLKVLEGELNFVQSLDSRLNLIEANVVGEEYFPDGRSILTLNKGSFDGIEIGNVVSLGNYLLGRVQRVSQHSAVVMSLLDGDFKASCVDQDSPHRTDGICSTKGGVLMFGNLDPGLPVNIGDNIVTSGKDGSYPSGRLVGKVIQVNGDLYDLSRAAILEVLFKNIPSVVFVETGYEEL